MNPATSELAVDVRHLSRAFRGTDALVDVSLQIPVGSIFGLVGLNGAGKTTLIRHLIGSLKALRGSVTVLGRGSSTAVCQDEDHSRADETRVHLPQVQVQVDTL